MSEDSDDIEMSLEEWVVFYFSWWLPNFILFVLALTIAFVIIELFGGYLDPYVTEELSFVSCLVQFVVLGCSLLLIAFFASFTPMGRAWLELDEEDES